MRAAKIVATVGPASADRAILRALVEAGADVFRFNLSHGTPAEHAGRIRELRALASELDRNVGVLIDVQGPKIRLGKFEGGGCTLAAGARFTITTEPVLGNAQRASTSYDLFARDVKPGDRVLLNDGAVELRAIEAAGNSVQFEVVSGGPVADRKGINLPGVKVSSPALTDKDRSDLDCMLAEQIDFVALSFVRSAADIRDLREVLERRGADLPIVAKIEKPEAWDNQAEILDETDGIMVARGDLGVEMPLEKVPFIQKSLIAGARARGKFSITATQMLESMVQNPSPTRAEASDVANAIADGSDAVMLSAETSTGKHPVEAVRCMAKIGQEADRSMREIGFPPIPEEQPRQHADLIADAAFEAAQAGSVGAIVVYTSSGATARLVARQRPPVPVYAFTPSEAVARRMTILYGVRAAVVPEMHATDEILAHMDRALLEIGSLRPGSGIAIVAGLPPGSPGKTNLLKLHRLAG